MYASWAWENKAEIKQSHILCHTHIRMVVVGCRFNLQHSKLSFLFFGLYFFSFFSSFFGFYYLCSASSQRNIFSVLPCIYHRTRVSARVIVTQWLRWQKYGSDKVISSNCKVFFLVSARCVCKCFALVDTCHRSILCSLEKRHKYVYESPMYISTFPLLLKRDNVFLCLCVACWKRDHHVEWAKRWTTASDA